jgi:hypothetical protein
MHLDHDPVRYADVLAQLPALQEIHDYVAAGHDPAALPTDVLAGLRDLDAAFVRQELAPPAAFFLDLKPATEPVRARTGAFSKNPDEGPELLFEGWSATAAREFLQAAQEYRAMKEEFLRRGPDMFGSRGAFSLAGMVGFNALHDYLLEIFQTPPFRPHVSARLRPSALHLLRGLHAARKALATNGTSEILTLHQFRECLLHYYSLLHVGWLMLPLEVLAGGPPENELQALLFANLGTRVDQLRSNAGEDPSEVMEKVLKASEQALQAPLDPPERRSVHMNGLDRLITEATRIRDVERIEMVLTQHLDEIRRFPLEIRSNTFVNLLTAVVQAGKERVPPRETLEVLLTSGATRLANTHDAGTHDALRSALERLRSWKQTHRGS